MADTSGMQDLRGLDVDKLAKGYADEEFIFKQFVTVAATSAREIRWYQKTTGVLTGTTTTGITGNLIANTDQLALPTVAERSWTRLTSYVRKYFVESPIISSEDIRDTDIDILAVNVRDLTRAVASAVDTRIWNVVTENLTPSTINSTAAVGTGWDDATNGNPILDILSGAARIRSYGYDISDMVLIINPIEYKNLMNFLISTKGSSIPALASSLAEKGVLMTILNHRVVVSNNATTDYALQMVNKRGATWKTFTPITAATVTEVGIGTKIRVWEEGECLLTDPRAVCLITDTVT